MDWPLFISILALLGTVSANTIAERARRAAAAADRRSGALALAQKKTEVLLELETQRSKLHTLKVVQNTKLFLLRRHRPLADANPDEIARLEENIRTLEDLLARHETQVEAAENLGNDASVANLERMLADIKRLTIRATENLLNEERGLEEVRRELERVGA